MLMETLQRPRCSVRRPSRTWMVVIGILTTHVGQLIVTGGEEKSRLPYLANCGLEEDIWESLAELLERQML